VTIATVSLLIGGLEAYRWYLSRDWIAENLLNLARLKRDRPIGAVFIGNSLLLCGLPFDDELTSVFNNTKLALPILRITYSDLRDDDLLEIYERILAARPKQLFLQAELYSARFWNKSVRKSSSLISPSEYPFLKRLRWMLSTIKSRLIQGEPISPAAENKDGNFECGDNRATNMEEMYKHLSFRPSEHLSEHQSFFRQAAEAGISVYFLELGRAPTADRYIEDTLGVRVHDELNAIADLYGIPLISRQGKFTDQDFLDHVHMNSSGRASFTTQLLDQMRESE